MSLPSVGAPPPGTATDTGPAAPPPTSAPPPRAARSAATGRIVLALALALAALAVLTAVSLATGAGDIGARGALDYLLNRHGARSDTELELVVGRLRLPRTTAALLVGAALGLAGALLQSVTRNPLAETGLLGVNAGASLAVVCGIAFAGVETSWGYLLWAFGGAVAASGVVLLIAQRGGGSPMRLVLAGSALGATFGGLTNVVVVGSAETYDRYRQWILGSLAGTEGWGEIGRLLPVLAAGFLLAALTVRPLSALALGDDLARGLGHRPGRTRTLVAAATTLLTASAIALAGPIAFLGLLAGLLARAVTGPRLAAQLPLAALTGAAVLTGADILARVVARPFETPVAVIVTLIGAPVLIAVVRTRRLGAMGVTDPGEADAVAAPRRPRRLLPRRPVRTTPAAPARLLLRGGSLSLLLTRRALLAGAALAAGLLAAVVLATWLGQSQIGLTRTAAAVFGSGDRFDVLLVQDFRLGRIVAALAAGTALGIAGCLTQTIARNRLATPELLGVNDGATAAVLLSVQAGGTLGYWWTGPLGSLAAVTVVLLLAGGLGGQGYRVLIVGLSATALASAVIQVLLARRSLSSAGSVYVWTTGSLNGRGYESAVPVLLCLALLVPLTVAAARHLDVLRFDDDTTASLGTPVARTRALCLGLAVILAGLAVGVCGPVGFVALAAPVLASRVAGPGRVPVLTSGLLGALLVLTADTIGRNVLDGAEIPVGVITTLLGGPFLLWVLLGRSRAAARP